MKFPTKEETSEYMKAVTVGGLKGGAIGVGISILGMSFINKRYPAFKTYGAFPRTFVTIFPVLLVGVTSMELASRKFEIQKYGYLDEYQEQERKRRQQESVGAQALEWVSKHRYPLIGGAWAASMAGSWVIVNRDKLMTKSQKIVQARMYAQGITVVLLIGSMILNMTEPVVPEKRKEEWEILVDDETKREEKQHLPLNLKDRLMKKEGISRQERWQ